MILIQNGANCVACYARIQKKKINKFKFLERLKFICYKKGEGRKRDLFNESVGTSLTYHIKFFIRT